MLMLNNKNLLIVLILNIKNFNKLLLNGNVFPTFGFFFYRRENDLLNQEIRIFRTLDEIDLFAELNESNLVGFEKVSINDFSELLDFDFFQFLEKFDFSSIPIFSFTTFQK